MCPKAAPHRKIEKATIVANQKPPENQMQRIPQIPVARLATATSNWKGLPGSHPIYFAVRSALNVCMIKPMIPETPTQIIKVYKRKVSMTGVFEINIQSKEQIIVIIT